MVQGKYEDKSADPDHMRKRQNLTIPALFTTMPSIFYSHFLFVSRSCNSWYIFSSRASLSLTSFLLYPWLFIYFGLRFSGLLFKVPPSYLSVYIESVCLVTPPLGVLAVAATMPLLPKVRIPRDRDLDYLWLLLFYTRIFDALLLFLIFALLVASSGIDVDGLCLEVVSLIEFDLELLGLLFLFSF